MRRAGQACGLALAIANTAHAADRQQLGLDLIGGYRGTRTDSPWDSQSETELLETLQAAWDGYLIDRSFASFHLGFALDHRTSLQRGRREDLFSFRYDLRLDLWKRKLLPITLYANRQTFDTLQASVPGYRSTTDTWGYSAAFAPKRLPRLQSSGFVRDLRAERDGKVEHLRTTGLRAELLHTDNKLVVRGSLDQRDQIQTGRRRDVTDSQIYADYSLDKRTDVIARAQLRRFDTVAGREALRLEAQSSDVVVRWRPRDDLRGSAYQRLQRTTLQDTRTTDASVGSTWLWMPRTDLSVGLDAGASVATLAEAHSNPARLYGEHFNTTVDTGRQLRNMAYQVSAQGGVAALQEPGVGSGVQGGGVVDGLLSRSLGLQLSRITVGGTAGRQWDTSPRQQSYRLLGWNLGLDTSQLTGLDLHLSAGQRSVVQDVAERGSSNQFQVQAHARLELRPNLRGGYALLIYRDVLDADYASGVRHSLNLVGRPFPSLTLSGTYFFDAHDASGLAAAATHRFDGVAEYTFAGFKLAGRLDWTHTGGRLPKSDALVGWLELSRSFDWAF